MTWHLTEDPEAFRAAVGEYLAAASARNTVLLTQLDVPGTRGWWTDPVDGRVTGAFMVPSPGPGPGRWAPVLGTMPDAAAHALATRLSDTASFADVRGVRDARGIRGVRGESGTVEVFVAALGRRPVRTRRMRLFRLGALTPPHPAPPGRARVAGPEDVPLGVAWMREFARDIGEDPDADYTANVEGRVAGARLHLWEVAGEPVAMASVSRLVAGQARVSPVYTPPAHRARGYGGAVTSAVSRKALDEGAGQVLLFTDLANPTSNALYQRLGYRPIGEHSAVEFD
ncbi:GNAT family N-acetyltransferase [Streptomyces sp. 2RAF24]|uniref:GNAT family N-acetyltransferase n=1 Tax=unclassified Streptomyces TaxID=2593676 RepID=UPI0033CD4405